MSSLLQFLDEIFKFKDPKDYIELRFFDPTGKPSNRVFFNTTQEVSEYVKKNSKEKNCYFGIHPRSTQRGTQDAVSTFFTVYADIDFDKKLSKESLEKKILDFGILPSASVYTGHGIQVYYCLDKPYEWFEIKKTLLRLINYYHADELKNKDRVFRLPETTNVKYKPWKNCVLHTLNKKRYSLEIINAMLTAKDIPTIIEKEEIKTDQFLLSPEIMSLGFIRREGRWEKGKCPNCGNLSLYIYDNNPKVTICSHTGNCNYSTQIVELEQQVKRKKQRIEAQAEAQFEKKSFIYRVKNQPPALKVGYPKLDENYSFRAGTINLIAGRLGTGKSTVAYNLLLNMANLYPEENFLLFTYEIPKDLVYIRLLTIEYARASNSSIEFKEMEEEIKIGGLRADAAIKRLERLNNIFIYDDPDLHIDQLQEIVAETRNVGAVMIDYLECVKVKNKPTEELRVSSISSGLKKFTIKLNQFPIFLLSQLNRSPKERKDQRPQEQDVRYSDKAMQDAAIAWGLFNPSMNKTPKKTGNEEDLEESEEISSFTKLEIIGMKNRYGKRARDFLNFDQSSGLITSNTRKFPEELLVELKKG